MGKASVYVFLLFTLSSFSQSAWVQKNGEAYTQISYSIIGNYTGLYGDPDYATERSITDNTLQLYGEYGLSDRTTAIVGIPFKFLEAGNLVVPETFNNPITSEDNKVAFGNLLVGIRHKLYSKNWIISGQFNLEAPTGTYDNSPGLRTGYDSWTFSPTLNIGRSFKGFFVQGFGGFDIRTNQYSSNYKLGVEIGARPLKPILLIGFLNATGSFHNGNIQLPASNLLTGLYVNDQEYVAYGLKAIAELNPNLGLLAGYTGALSGKNVPKREVLSFGAFYKF